MLETGGDMFLPFLQTDKHSLSTLKVHSEQKETKRWSDLNALHIKILTTKAKHSLRASEGAWHHSSALCQKEWCMLTVALAAFVRRGVCRKIAKASRLTLISKPLRAIARGSSTERPYPTKNKWLVLIKLDELEIEESSGKTSGWQAVVTWKAA